MSSNVPPESLATMAPQDQIPTRNEVDSEARLVDFIVIGAMRAGTTMLHEILAAHPEIAMARMKETDYFILQKNFSRGRDWYIAQFADDRPFRGEISPNYSKSRDFPDVPQRIFKACPDVRLIYVLRDPITRAMSQFRHSWNMGKLTETPEQMAGGHKYLSILDASSYAHQMDAYLQYFDRSQILVLDFETLLADPQGQLDAILAHIGASPMVVPELSQQNGNDELKRVPKSMLRLTQSRLRPILTTLFSPKMRGRLRRLMARGPVRSAPTFSEALLQRMRNELAPDTARLRQQTGQEFERWSI